LIRSKTEQLLPLGKVALLLLLEILLDAVSDEQIV